MTDEQLIIWAAGFFDGEGCVSIDRQRSNRKLKNADRKTRELHQKSTLEGDTSSIQ